jgi:hypothetical protein
MVAFRQPPLRDQRAARYDSTNAIADAALPR